MNLLNKQLTGWFARCGSDCSGGTQIPSSWKRMDSINRMAVRDGLFGKSHSGNGLGEIFACELTACRIPKGVRV